LGEIQKTSRLWMEKYYEPSELIQFFVRKYSKLLRT